MKKDNDISESERRFLQQKPIFSFESIFDKSYFEEIEKYSLDQFILRDNFRSFKAKINNNLFLKLDNNDLFIIDDIIYKKEKKINHKSIENFNQKIENITKQLTKENNVHLMVIPQKEYYVEEKIYQNINYDEIFNNLPHINLIDIRHILNKNDFYKTDTHLKQENLDKVIDEILNKLNIKKEAINYTQNIIDNFYGVYYGQALVNSKPETIYYLTNNTIKNAQVNYLESSNKSNVYILENSNRLDKYDIFLDGASSFIEINNNNNITKRELVIFRDSFTSNIAPLLIDYYSKITLIDTRYITSKYYFDLIDFTNQDVLFIYSTHLINNSFILKD